MKRFLGGWFVCGVCLAWTASAEPPAAFAVEASAETAPVRHLDDAADDPAIWIDPSDPDGSLIVGTDKEGGIALYDLRGDELQYLADGAMNNVDLRAGVKGLAAGEVLAAASDRTRNAIALYRLDTRGRRLIPAGSIPCGMEVYGLCMYRDAADGTAYVFINSKDGTIQQWRIDALAEGGFGGALVRTLRCAGQVEGCVADDAEGVLYVGEELKGIWRFSAKADGPTEGRLVAETSASGPLHADVEGLAIYRRGEERNLLVASSQGNSSFVVYDRSRDYAVAGVFRVGAGADADEVTGTDGLDVCSTPAGPGFPLGLFVAQDDDNDGAAQNYKIVPWHLIESGL